MKQKILLVGEGAREDALLRKVSESPQAGELFIARGNAGTARFATNVEIDSSDIEGLATFAAEMGIHTTIVGQDKLIASGIVNRFRQSNLRIFGPSSNAGLIESSKPFAKQLMATAGIPTASSRVFNDFVLALEYVQQEKRPLVVKAGGLALGKGTYRCYTTAAAEDALSRIMIHGEHGEAGKQVVIEDMLVGRELSAHAFCSFRNGIVARMMPFSRDYKELNGDMTGGMGTYAPVSWAADELLQEVYIDVVLKALEQLNDQKTPYMGCLYPGLMLTDAGTMVLEYNARFGDPEAQVLMRLLVTDLLDIVDACIDGTLNEQTIEWRSGSAVCVVLASEGYPDPKKIKTGRVISGIDKAESVAGVVVYHAGTAMQDGSIVTTGGRVLSVTAYGDTLRTARDRAYEAVNYVHFDGMQYLDNIAEDALSG